MSPELLDALMRIKLHEDTPATFDVNKATSRYLEHHLRCDREMNQPPVLPQPSQTCPSVQSEAAIMASGEIHDHTYAPPAIPEIQKKPSSECIAIISKASGKALTAIGKEVVLSTFKGDENQLWFTWDGFIVSNYDGNVIERNRLAGSSVILSAPNQGNDRQKWDMVGHLHNLETTIESPEGDLQLTVLGVVNENGAKIGASKRAKVTIQLWGIESMNNYLPVTSNEPLAFSRQSRISPPTEGLIEKLPDERLFQIKNSWASMSLTVLSDNHIYVMNVLPDEGRSKWFKRGSHIVAPNGKVLKNNGPGKPVTLAIYDADDASQKWNFESSGDTEIMSVSQELKLNLIKDAWNSEVVLVGTRLADQAENPATDLWQIDLLSTATSSSENTRIAKPADANLFAIVNGWKDTTALTATANGVRIEPFTNNNPNQLWFSLNSAIISFDGRALQVSENGQRATLVNSYDRSNPKQNWNIRPVGNPYYQRHRIESSYNNLMLDLLGEDWGWYDEIIDAGGCEEKVGTNDAQQLWMIKSIDNK